MLHVAAFVCQLQDYLNNELIDITLEKDCNEINLNEENLFTSCEQENYFDINNKCDEESPLYSKEDDDQGQSDIQRAHSEETLVLLNNHSEGSPRILTIHDQNNKDVSSTERGIFEEPFSMKIQNKFGGMTPLTIDKGEGISSHITNPKIKRSSDLDGVYASSMSLDEFHSYSEEASIIVKDTPISSEGVYTSLEKTITSLVISKSSIKEEIFLERASVETPISIAEPPMSLDTISVSPEAALILPKLASFTEATPSSSESANKSPEAAHMYSKAPPISIGDDFVSLDIAFPSLNIPLTSVLEELTAVEGVPPSSETISTFPETSITSPEVSNKSIINRVSVSSIRAFTSSKKLPIHSKEVPMLSEVPILSEEVPVLSEEVPILSEEIPILSKEIPILSKEIPILSEEVLIPSKAVSRSTENTPASLEKVSYTHSDEITATLYEAPSSSKTALSSTSADQTSSEESPMSLKKVFTPLEGSLLSPEESPMYPEEALPFSKGPPSTMNKIITLLDKTRSLNETYTSTDESSSVIIQPSSGDRNTESSSNNLHKLDELEIHDEGFEFLLSESLSEIDNLDEFIEGFLSEDCSTEEISLNARSEFNCSSSEHVSFSTGNLM